MGSGVSASGGSGLPTWNELLTDLATVAGMSPNEIEIIKQMNYLDAARVVEIKLGGSRQLTRAVAKRVTGENVSLACALLAGLNVREVQKADYVFIYLLTFMLGSHNKL